MERADVRDVVEIREEQSPYLVNAYLDAGYVLIDVGFKKDWMWLKDRDQSFNPQKIPGYTYSQILYIIGRTAETPHASALAMEREGDHRRAEAKRERKEIKQLAALSRKASGESGSMTEAVHNPPARS